MKLLKTFVMLALILIIPNTNFAWSGAEGLFVVYNLERSDVSGELTLRPVEIQFDLSGNTNPTYGVFAEWLRPYIHDTNKVDLEQINKAYCKGLNVEIKHEKRERMDVLLDYTACSGKNKPTSAKDKLLEGIAAAIFYTENVPKIQAVSIVSLHIKGISDQKEITKDYYWPTIQKKWQPWMAGFQDRCK